MLKIKYDGNTGSWVFSYGRHILFSLGIAFVVGGIGALSGPWWLPVLYAVLDKADVQVNDTFQIILGVVLLLVGVLIIVGKLALDSWVKKVKKDVQRIDSVQFSISDLKEYFSSLYDDHSYLSSLDTNFYHSIHGLEGILPEMETNELKPFCSAYLEAARKLHNFVAYNFFIFPDHQIGDWRYCMHPDLNIDRGLIGSDQEKERRYRDYSQKLHSLIESAEEAWSELYYKSRRRGAFSNKAMHATSA